nr:hypothetical protein OG999_09615 [Streptomyces sp. NBC_00886]
MRRTARVLSVVALVGVVGGAAAPALAADPAAEVSPSTVQAGGSLTVSVSCEAIGGTAPDTIEASSQAFDEGTVELRRVPGNDDRAASAAYRGTARISDQGVGRDPAWTADGTCPAPPGGQGRPWSATFTVERGGGQQPQCQEARAESCGAAVIERGVRAGEGGTFADSVPALVAGGVLIAGAFGGAVYRLRRRTPGH